MFAQAASPSGLVRGKAFELYSASLWNQYVHISAALNLSFSGENFCIICVHCKMYDAVCVNIEKNRYVSFEKVKQNGS
jgi:hypothetical protein